MKRADIKPGEIYAYRRGQYSLYGMFQEIKFLTPLDNDHLYQYARTFKNTGDFYERQDTATRPHADSFYGDVGYLAATGYGVLHATLEEAVKYGHPQSEDDARRYRYQVRATTTAVHGLYTKVIATQEAERQADREMRERQRAEKSLRDNTMVLLNARLAELGVNVRRSIRHEDRFELTVDAAKELIAKLEGK